MRVLLVHPSALMYSEIFLRLEPLGMERVAGAAREAGHRVHMIDLQTESHTALERRLNSFRPEAIGVSLNYLANIPEPLKSHSASPQCRLRLPPPAAPDPPDLQRLRK